MSTGHGEPAERSGLRRFAGRAVTRARPWYDRARDRLGAWAGAHLLMDIAVSALALALSAKVGEDVVEHESGPFDNAVRGWVLAHRSGIGLTVFGWITRVGAAGVVFTCGMLLAAWLWYARGRRVASSSIVAPTVAMAIFELIKQIVRRGRPPGAALVGLTTYAFPSGHSTTSAAVIPAAAYVLWREGFLPGRAACVIGAALPLLIGLSRVYLDVHWATDVLAGWSVGVFVATIAAIHYEWLRRSLASRGAVADVARPPRLPRH